MDYKIDDIIKAAFETGKECLADIADIAMLANVSQLPTTQIASVLAKMFKIGDSFRDKLLLQKITYFVTYLYSQQNDENEYGKCCQFLTYLNEHKDENSVAIFLKIIDDFQSLQQIEYLCRLVICLKLKQIEKDDFFRLVHMIRRCTASDLIQLTQFRQPNNIQGVTDSLHAVGLISLHDIDEHDMPLYTITASGSQIIRYALECKEQFIVNYAPNCIKPKWKIMGETLELNPHNNTNK